MFAKFLTPGDVRSHLLILIGMVAVIASALAFEHIGGYQPCKLCLEQRSPWYAGIPIAGLGVLAVLFQWPAIFSRLVLICVGLVLAYSLYLGVHHAGVEYGWWAGPGDCGVVEGGVAPTTDGLFQQLGETVPPSCDDAALRIMGLSFAGWNAVASAALAGYALIVATRR